MKKKHLLFIIATIFSFSASAQFNLYEDQFNGGVTGGSYSTGVSGTGNGVITLHIDPSSTIRKAYLIAGRLGPAPAFTVMLNAMSLTFDASNQVTPTFNCSLYGGASAVHAIDITSQVSPAVNVYNISYAQAGGGTDFFTDFYLYVAYENPSMPLVNTVIFLKTLDYLTTEAYSLTLAHPIDSLVPVGFAMHAGYMCDSATDGENINVASTLLGDIGGGDPNDPQSQCSGTSGSFYYENNTLYGLNGDSADQAMHGADALSDIKALLPNMTTTFNVQFDHAGGGTSADNSMWGWIMAYGIDNQPPNAVFSSPNHICPGTCTDFINHSTNATSFQWFFSGANPSVSTDINPTSICYNSPGQYDVMLIATNSNGSDTLLLHNYITVYPYPPPQGITQNGDTLFANPGAVSYQWYQDGNNIPGATDYFYVAASSGSFSVVATDQNGCEVEAVIFDVVAGISSPGLSSEEGVTAFPNPVKDEMTIQAPGSLNTKTFHISVYNLLSEKVLTQDLIAAPQSHGVVKLPLDFSSLSKGMYWLQVIEGEKIYSWKILKD